MIQIDIKKKKQINMLNEEIKCQRIEEQMNSLNIKKIINFMKKK